MLSTQVRKYLIPDSNDQIRQQQMREIQVGKLLLLLAELTSNKPMSSIMSSCVLMYFHMSSCVLIFR